MALREQIDAAAASLIQRGSQDRARRVGSDRTALLFSGSVHHSIPHELLFAGDGIGPTEKTIWSIMRALFTATTTLTEAPRRDEIASLVPCSGPTVTKSRSILRLHRWMTLCRRVRDDQGRNVGDIYMLHEEPLPLWETLLLDPSYAEFLDDMACATHDRYPKAAKTLAIETLDQVGALESPKQTTLLGGVMHRIQKAESRGKILTPANPPETTSKTQKSTISGHSGSQSKILTLDTGHQGKNLTPVADRGKNLSHSSCCSSFNNNTNSRPRENESLPVSAVPPTDLDALCGLEIAEVSRLIERYFPWLEESPYLEPIAWTFVDRLPYLQILSRMFQQSLTPELSQLLLCQLLGKLLAAKAGLATPIRNLPAYVRALIERQNKGEFQLDEYGEEVRAALELNSTYHSPLLDRDPVWHQK